MLSQAHTGRYRLRQFTAEHDYTQLAKASQLSATTCSSPLHARDHTRTRRRQFCCVLFCFPCNSRCACGDGSAGQEHERARQHQASPDRNRWCPQVGLHPTNGHGGPVNICTCRYVMALDLRFGFKKREATWRQITLPISSCSPDRFALC